MLTPRWITRLLLELDAGGPNGRGVVVRVEDSWARWT